MAIDTREKRASAAAISFDYRNPSVTNNSAKDQEWRQEVGHSYSGVLASSTAAPAAPTEYHGFIVNQGRMMH